MPLYEFECKSCDNLVEVLVRSQDDVAECPTCGETELQRVLSVPASPSVKSGKSSLPVAGAGESCGAPRCCGGGCQI
jgi:putative FmdB family regulatory protein